MNNQKPSNTKTHPFDTEAAIEGSRRINKLFAEALENGLSNIPESFVQDVLRTFTETANTAEKREASVALARIEAMDALSLFLPNYGKGAIFVDKLRTESEKFSSIPDSDLLSYNYLFVYLFGEALQGRIVQPKLSPRAKLQYIVAGTGTSLPPEQQPIQEGIVCSSSAFNDYFSALPFSVQYHAISAALVLVEAWRMVANRETMLKANKLDEEVTELLKQKTRTSSQSNHLKNQTIVLIAEHGINDAQLKNIHAALEQLRKDYESVARTHMR